MKIFKFFIPEIAEKIRFDYELLGRAFSINSSWKPMRMVEINDLIKKLSCADKGTISLDLVVAKAVGKAPLDACINTGKSPKCEWGTECSEGSFPAYTRARNCVTTLPVGWWWTLGARICDGSFANKGALFVYEAENRDGICAKASGKDQTVTCAIVIVKAHEERKLVLLANQYGTTTEVIAEAIMQAESANCKTEGAVTLRGHHHQLS
ncbi:MAG: hypothetical protein HQM00_11730 [Magnetococcales bacterium]|nr:hypothetical protein [Magnetococcales bacterium]